MKNLLKFLKRQIDQFNCKYKYWWVVCFYLFVPTLLIFIFGKFFTQLLHNLMKSINVESVVISNSEYAINNVIDPFAKSLSIIIGFIISYIILRLLQKKLLKKEVYFLGANTCIKFIETVTILLAIIVAVYSKMSSFDCFRYGYSVDTIKESIIQEKSVLYIPLEEIPSVQSIGIETKNEISLYSILLHMSQLGYYLSDNLEIIIAIIGAVIIPLKNYSEEVDNCFL